MLRNALFLSSLLIPFHVVTAAPPDGTDRLLEPWYQSLKTANGMPCCGAADCRGPAVYPVRIRDGGYEVMIDHEWRKVPPDAVSDRTDNPTGAYVTCVQEDFWLGGIREPQILCLFKAPGT